MVGRSRGGRSVGKRKGGRRSRATCTYCSDIDGHIVVAAREELEDEGEKGRMAGRQGVRREQSDEVVPFAGIASFWRQW